MQKIDTVFERGDNFGVVPKVVAGCEWVLKGDGTPTEKLDGTNVRITVEKGKIVLVEKRRNPSKEEARRGMEPGYTDASRDNPADKHIFRAVDGTSVSEWPDGKHECEAVGPKIQGNPLELASPTLYPFRLSPVILDEIASRTFETIKDWVLGLESRYAPNHLAEGIVFHHPDGRMAKIKLKDFK